MWIFQHLPKVGGTSVTTALRNVFGTGNMYSFQGLYPNDHHRFFVQHDMSVELVTGHVNFGFHQATKKPCRYVTIMREPVQRVISQWYTQYWWRLNSVHTHEGVHDFEEFVSGTKTVIGNNLITRMISGWPNDINKTFATLTGSCTGAMYKRAVANINQWYDFVGFQMTMQASFDRMLQVMGRDPGVQVPMQNTTKDNVRTEKAPLPENAEKLAMEHNQYDLALYYYCWERFDGKGRDENSDDGDRN